MIVAPKSVIPNWMKEFAKWTPHFWVVNLKPTKEEREEILANQMVDGKFDICLTTYEGVTICFNSLKKFKFHYMIIDEAHKLKNADSKIFKLSR